MTGKVSIAGCLLAAVIVQLSTVNTVRAAGVCPEVYLPVCAVSDLGLRMTYTNACWAKMANAKILHAGQCQGPICNQVYKPVCARAPTGGLRTYSNLCEAEVANAVFVHNGICRKK